MRVKRRLGRWTRGAFEQFTLLCPAPVPPSDRSCKGAIAFLWLLQVV
ncbi:MULTISPECIES: hypothetical protein [Nostocales]|uniref:Transposase n=2 Tax=Nostocales TaxID=1161 RepID=A0ABW8WXQ7_9CYAN|nr:hypothetical protein [Tolypothrix bouteillei]